MNAFRNALALRGVDGLLRPALQSQYLQAASDPIATEYDPNPDNVDNPGSKFPKDDVDFALGSAYGVYNWEVFFHAPILIATRLGAEGRYEEAMRWFHFVFDPTDGKAGTDATRFWKFKPFADNHDLATIQENLEALAENAYAQNVIAWANAETDTATAHRIAHQIAEWRDDPFDPHLLARMRPVAYQKMVVMKYIDNLLAWADRLFAQDTMESVNEATQLYVTASNLLGKRPVLVTEPGGEHPQSYGELDDASAFDAFSNALVGTEVIVPKPPLDVRQTCRRGAPPPTVIWGSLYFCVPPNEKLLGYWDLVADRLFKIRHCQNIEGVTRTLPLYAPPIDPALLVRAAAAGLDLSTVLFDLSIAAPPYRYAVVHAKAVEMASAVASLGASLLSALEKEDAEHLALVRQSHEIAIQELVRETRKRQLDEAEENLRAVHRSKALAQERFDFYSSRERVSDAETASLALTSIGQGFSMAGSLLHSGAGLVSYVPDLSTGVTGPAPSFSLTFGGRHLTAALSAAAMAADGLGSSLAIAGNVVGTLASYDRRHDDWQLQARLAQKELDQIEAQIVAAEIRVEIANAELTTLDKQIAQARDVEDFLRRKFTNRDLYGWMKSQLAMVHYQGYKLAFEAARRAEKAFQFERGDKNQSFVRFDHWSDAKKGLLAGEKLLHDLRRMDSAYVAQNVRELELVKHVSLAKWASDALMSLRNGDAAAFSFPEALYDLDYQDHYFRRIKSIAATVHCTPGPYQSLAGTLNMLEGETRPTASSDRTRAPAVVASTALSQPQADTGLFQLDFSDGRYLPFEGAGAHYDGAGAQFTLVLSPGSEIDPLSITDVVLTVRYTARRGAAAVAVPAIERTHLLRVQDELADEWAAHLEDPALPFAFALPASKLVKARVQSLASIASMVAYVRWSQSTTGTLVLTRPDGSAGASGPVGGLYSRVDLPELAWDPTDVESTWSLTIPNPSRVTDLWLAVRYTTG